MTTQDIETRKKFIQGLELAAPRGVLATEKKPVRFDEGQDAGYVDAGGLVSFVGNLSTLHREDVLNSALLAQLAANVKHDREKDTQNWYKFYRTVLENVGWVVSDFSFQQFRASGDTFSVNDTVVKILAAIVSQSQMAIVMRTLEVLRTKATSGQRAWTIFNTSSYQDSSGNFQAGIAGDDRGLVVMAIGAFYFSSTQTSTQYLWYNYKTSDTTIYQGHQIINLNEGIYSRVREAVKEKLGDRAQEFVENLDIGF